MNFFPPLVGFAIVIIAIRLILKKVNPHAVLLFSGIFMLVIAWVIDMELPIPKESTGSHFLDFFRLVKESFAKTNAGVGLMIMSIGGFVSYIHHIGASSVLVQIAIKPLSIFKSKPNLLAVLVIPIGQLLFVCIPSAAGLGLLLMASVFPVLLKLGVSRISAASVITACTAFGVGPASAITARASEISGSVVISYFIEHQIPLVLPLSIFLSMSYYFVNKYFDAKNTEVNKIISKDQVNQIQKLPKIYALIPILPLFLLIIFSDLFQLFSNVILLDTTTAMLISLVVAMTFEWIRIKSISKVFNSLSVFWNGMGDIFKTVVTLIITAEIFSKGLISLGTIDALVYVSQNIGMEAIGIAFIMTVIIFTASMVMGSGNASFFAFAPLSSEIANSYDVSSIAFVLPMNLSASMGRALSPISGVLIAVSELAGVSSMDIVKRNFIPLTLNMILLLIIHFIL